MTDPFAIAKTALSRGELDKLLLSAPEYQYRSKWSPSPDVTDLTELLSVLYCFEDRERVKQDLVKALLSIISKYEGVMPVATCILFEAGKAAEGHAIGLPLAELASKLSESIENHSHKLAKDKTGTGRDERDGLYGDLRRLSHITQRYGGPAFWPGDAASAHSPQ